MTRYALTIFVTNDDIGPSVATLANTYGEVQVQALSYRQGFDDELSELTDDESAADIEQLLASDEVLNRFEDEITKLVHDPELTSAMVRGMIADVRGVQGRMTADNDAMRELDRWIDKLNARLVDLDAYEAHNRIQMPPFATDSDPTPPHGIPRLSGYYVIKPNFTQGSGPRTPGLERVACPSCGAPAGETCVTDSHMGYRREWGHTTRRKALTAALQAGFVS